MKRLILPFLLLPTLSFAQQPQNVDPAEMMRRFQDPAAMQKMAEQAQKASQCMEGIDEAQLNALRERAEAAGAEIDRLCAAGKKDEALARGLALSQELRSNATIKKLRECTKEMAESMKDLPWAGMNDLRGLEEDAEPNEEDICR